MKTEKEQIKENLSTLKMATMRDNLDDTLRQAEQEQWGHLRFFDELLQKEITRREESGKQSRIKAANFPQMKYLDELDRAELPDDARTILPELERLDFIREGRNVVLFGNPGTGKTHMSIGIGIRACQQGYRVLFTSVPKLILQITEARSQKTLTSLQNKFEKYDLVICDEFGYVSCNKEAGEMLFNHLSLRADKKATIITTNLAFDRWDEIIKDKVLVTAMVDRLTHKAFIVNMAGISYRLKETRKINGKK